MDPLIMVYPRYKEGAYAVVFFDTDGKATKVFRQRHDVPREHIENVFKSEVCAYRIAQIDQKLHSLVPNFLGEVVVEQITDAKGVDISPQFYLDIAYQMEKIEGDFVKIGSIPANIVKPVASVFKSAGIHHICDASVTIQDRCIVKVVDFATKEYEL